MEEVIVYTSDTCERCKTVKSMLNANNVKYTEVTDRDYILGLGLEGVPAIEVDDKIIDNYVSVLAWLKQNGYYSLSLWEGDEHEGN